jgi:hypothetical protein
MYRGSSSGSFQPQVVALVMAMKQWGLGFMFWNKAVWIEDKTMKE